MDLGFQLDLEDLSLLLTWKTIKYVYIHRLMALSNPAVEMRNAESAYVKFIVNPYCSDNKAVMPCAHSHYGMHKGGVMLAIELNVSAFGERRGDAANN